MIKKQKIDFLGSASSESLTVRIFYYELNPLNYSELKNVKYLTDYHLLGTKSTIYWPFSITT
ncbi:MAG TPA: hypothetical protein DDZ39_05020 [Flavobacteriaceae bacterium]|nr:hypothetical protein [Flavobacteriaceae bacterium]HBS13175.1 hypothetical protein [Flavobacteriaceae bacterium]